MGKMKLFCIPHAGASAYYYLPLKDKLENVDVEFIELKGRGRRLNEDLYHSFSEAVDDVYRQIREKCTGDYAIMGHSMGSLLTYEVYYKLLNNRLPLPKCLFFSSKEAPLEHLDKIHAEKLSENGLERIIRNLGGFDELEALNPEMKRFFYEIIRSDFNILDEYEYSEPAEKISCKVVVMAGSMESNLSYSHLRKWQELVENQISYYSFSGNHFYMKNQWKELADVIEANLK